MEYCTIDEMPHHATFYQDLHRLQFYFEILTCDPSIYMYNEPSQVYCIK